MKLKSLTGLCMGLCLTSGGVQSANPLDNFVERTVSAKDANEVVDKSAVVLDYLEGLPVSLLRKAEGIVIIPGMVTVAAGISGGIGRGIALIRQEEWSNPTFISLTKASFGIQMGAQSTDVILLFKKRKGLESMVNGQFELNAGAGLAAGPVGRSAEVAADIGFKSMIYSYSRSKGLFAGVSLGGSRLEIDAAANKGLYGKKVSVTDIFSGTVKTSSKAVKKLREVLNEKAEGAESNP